MDEGRKDPSGNLARELENLILNLDRIEDEAAELRAEADSGEVSPGRDVTSLPVSGGHASDADERLSAFRIEVFDHLSEIARSMRFLSNLVRVNHAELLNELLRTEQSLQDEINHVEKRIRGDLATMRWDLVAGSDADEDDSGKPSNSK